jgi:CHAT domain-containing protein
VGAHDLRSAFFASVQEHFALTIDLLMEMDGREPRKGYATAALETSERARARGLLDLLVEARAHIREGADPQLAAREGELERRLDASAAERHQLLGGEHTPEEAAALDKKIDELTGEYRAVQAQLRRKSPRYAALVQPQPLTGAEIQGQLDPDTILLVYWLGSPQAGRGWLWAVTRDGLTSHELPARAVVEAAARRFLDVFVEGKGRPADDKAAEDLGRMLLSPVGAGIAGKRVVVVSDGALQYVPFAALPLPSATPGARAGLRRPLVLDHEVVYEASASSLAVLRRERADRRPAPRAVAVLADPVFEKDDARVAAAGRTAVASAAALPRPRAELQRALATARARGAGTGLPRLPFARREAEAIAAAASPGGVLKALDFQASRQTATSGELGRYRVVHFATHGLLDAAHPELSGLVLSLVDEEGRDQDGFLRLHDIYNLHLPAELVVLSACQTGLGREIRGEGLVGLTRGFMYAGASRVVASLWQVDDVATAELMRAFYQGLLRDGQRPAAALRAAQVEMWRKPAWRSPYYWAGFVLQGEWR